jgi:hypothetical protein
MTSKLIVAAALCAFVGCKKKQTENAPPADKGTAVASGSAPAPDAAEAVNADTGAAPTAGIKFDNLPESWERTDDADGGKLENMVAVNDSKFPVDNALFTFTFKPVTAAGAPTDAAKYGEWHALATKTKVDKTENIGDAHYYAFADPVDPSWVVIKKVGDKLWQCGGSLYQDADYNKIPKIRDEQLALAKKICASMRR